MNFEQVDITGSRLIGAITELGHNGPKHHGIVIGQYPLDGNIYVAENCHLGYQLATVEDFISRYSPKADVEIHPNNGQYSDVEVAERALQELHKRDIDKYCLLTNNCESFSNRAMYNKSASNQVINTVIGMAVIIGAIWYIKKAK
ncbi:MAG: hypothetical protein H8D23_19325 [Candidatus Brocadiales bacterium]|nr:hypothetical protein [Candidatus Brocadiales bacterium]